MGQKLQLLFNLQGKYFLINFSFRKEFWSQDHPSGRESPILKFGNQSQSPSTYSLSNITSSSSLSQKLEEEALKWDIDYRALLWKEWTLMLMDTTTSNNYYDGFVFIPFKQIFLQSKTLENISYNVLVQPHSREDDTTLYELFRCCCVGEDNEIYNFVTQLRSIGEILKGKTKSPYYKTIISSVLEIVSQIKVNQNDSQSNSMYTSLQSLDNKIYEAESVSQGDLTPTKTKNLVDLYGQKRISLLKTLRKKNVEDMEEFFQTQEDNIKRNFKEIKGSVVLELQRIEEEKNQFYDNYELQLIHVTDQISETKAQQRDLMTLQNQLEEKLKEVKKEISEKYLEEQRLETEKKDLTLKMNTIKENYMMKKERIKEDETNQQEDIEVFQKMNEFITHSKTLLKESIQKKNSNIEVMYYKSSKNYIDQVENYLKNILEDLSSHILKIEKVVRDAVNQVSEFMKKSDPTLKENVKKSIQIFDKHFKLCERQLTEVNHIYQELKVFPENDELNLSTKKSINYIEKIAQVQTVIYKFKDRVKIIEKDYFQEPEKKKEIVENRKDSGSDEIKEILKEEIKKVEPKKEEKKVITPKKEDSKKNTLNTPKKVEVKKVEPKPEETKMDELPPMFSFGEIPKKVESKNKEDENTKNNESINEDKSFDDTKKDDDKTETLPSIFDFGSPKLDPEQKDQQTKKKKKKKNYRKEERKQKEDDRNFE